MQEQVVIIVGAGPSGLATAACLTLQSVSYIILERDDCYAPLWKKKSYDRLHLHLAKQFCELPHMSLPPTCPTYVPREQFIHYLDDYVSHFKIKPLYKRSVECANYDEATKKWILKVNNKTSPEAVEEEKYCCRFLVVATGETTDPFIPEVEGLDTFAGEYFHTTQYRSGKGYGNKNVLVVGAGNSGMEIALDLSNHGAKTSIVVRSPIHVISRGMTYMALVLLKYLPLKLVDSLLLMLSKFTYGDLTMYGIQRPKEGAYTMKVKYGKYPVIDVGTCEKIKSGEIQVLPAVKSVKGKEVVFEDGKSYPFDVIVFATGFKRSTNKWLKDDQLLNNDGLPKPSFPNHWKGDNGLFCVGLARRGLYGINMDVQNIANDIKLHL